MSLADLSEPVVVVKGDGTLVKLRRITPTDRITYRWVFRTYRAVVLKHFMEVTGYDPLPALKELAAQRLKDSDVDKWVFELEGQREAVLLSLRSGKPEAEQKSITLADVDALGFDDNQLFYAAVGVMNLKLAEKTGGPGDPLPKGAATTTGTGSPTPPTSPDICESPATPSTSPATSSAAA